MLELYDFDKLKSEHKEGLFEGEKGEEEQSGDAYRVKSFATKNTPVMKVQFTMKNLLHATGRLEKMR